MKIGIIRKKGIYNIDYYKRNNCYYIFYNNTLIEEKDYDKLFSKLEEVIEEEEKSKENKLLMKSIKNYLLNLGYR